MRSTAKAIGWAELEGMMRSIEAAHGGLVAVMLSPRGIGATGGLDIIIFSTFADAEPGVVEGVETSSRWPNYEGRSIEAHIFEGLYQHDGEVAAKLKVWREVK